MILLRQSKAFEYAGKGDAERMEQINRSTKLFSPCCRSAGGMLGGSMMLPTISKAPQTKVNIVSCPTNDDRQSLRAFS